MAASMSIQGLGKDFGRFTALQDVSFEVPEGAIFGLLGPNGAGKTTLFSIAAGFLSASRGRVEVLGTDVREISALRGRYSMLPQDAAFQGGIPVIEQLVMFARLNGFSYDEAEAKAIEALELVGLGDVARRNARALSHGMMKRVALCQAFLGSPELMLLDEPTAGLDPENARGIRELVRGMRGQRTVVISSHNLREIQELCDHAAILHEGKLEACASMDELTSSGTLVRITLGEPLTDAAAADLQALPQVASLERTGPMDFNLQLDIESGDQKDEALKSINKCLIGTHDLVPRSLNEGASLERRFLEITGGLYDGSSSS
ncbi:MAG: ABC transporter ATP-binding protein [Planctomycetota bacterium]|nr:ABC transporter ATP-binding protein [Planctomycetota bacterium]